MNPENSNNGTQGSENVPPDDRTEVKQPYVKPTLTRYGRVATLSKGGAVSIQSDSGMNSMRPP